MLAATAEAVQVDGGVRVTGRWHYNTGSWHAQWAVLGIPIADIDGEIVDQGLALIPRYDLQFDETWFAAGMRSAGSNCLTADDVFDMASLTKIVAVWAGIGTLWEGHQLTLDDPLAALMPGLAGYPLGPVTGPRELGSKR